MTVSSLFFCLFVRKGIENKKIIATSDEDLFLCSKMHTPRLPILLASQSPRRRELMTLMHLPFNIEIREVEESYPAHLSPSEICQYIAAKKAEAFQDVTEKLIITADTIVALKGSILGKPKDEEAAFGMLRALSGTSHEVFTGVTLREGIRQISFYDRTLVHCRSTSEEEIRFYIDEYQPFDKAGSYGIQDWWGVNVVQGMEGSYTNVMGLPTEKLYRTLKEYAWIK